MTGRPTFDASNLEITSIDVGNPRDERDPRRGDSRFQHPLQRSLDRRNAGRRAFCPGPYARWRWRDQCGTRIPAVQTRRRSGRCRHRRSPNSSSAAMEAETGHGSLELIDERRHVPTRVSSSGPARSSKLGLVGDTMHMVDERVPCRRTRAAHRDLRTDPKAAYFA